MHQEGRKKGTIFDPGVQSEEISAKRKRVQIEDVKAEAVAKDDNEENPPSDLEDVSWEAGDVEGQDTVGNGPEVIEDDTDEPEDAEITVIPNDGELDVKSIDALPNDIRRDVIESAKRKLRVESRQSFMPVAANPSKYSEAQIFNFLKTCALNKKVMSVGSSRNTENQGSTIASDARRRYVMYNEEEKKKEKKGLKRKRFPKDGLSTSDVATGEIEWMEGKEPIQDVDSMETQEVFLHEGGVAKSMDEVIQRIAAVEGALPEEKDQIQITDDNCKGTSKDSTKNELAFDKMEKESDNLETQSLCSSSMPELIPVDEKPEAESIPSIIIRDDLDQREPQVSQISSSSSTRDGSNSLLATMTHKSQGPKELDGEQIEASVGDCIEPPTLTVPHSAKQESQNLEREDKPEANVIAIDSAGEDDEAFGGFIIDEDEACGDAEALNGKDAPDFRWERGSQNDANEIVSDSDIAGEDISRDVAMKSSMTVDEPYAKIEESAGGEDTVVKTREDFSQNTESPKTINPDFGKSSIQDSTPPRNSGTPSSSDIRGIEIEFETEDIADGPASPLQTAPTDDSIRNPENYNDEALQNAIQTASKMANWAGRVVRKVLRGHIKSQTKDISGAHPTATANQSSQKHAVVETSGAASSFRDDSKVSNPSGKYSNSSDRIELCP